MIPPNTQTPHKCTQLCYKVIKIYSIIIIKHLKKELFLHFILENPNSFRNIYETVIFYHLLSFYTEFTRGCIWPLLLNTLVTTSAYWFFVFNRRQYMYIQRFDKNYMYSMRSERILWNTCTICTCTRGPFQHLCISVLWNSNKTDLPINALSWLHVLYRNYLIIMLL